MENQNYKEKLEEIQKAVAELEEPLKSKAIDKLLEEAFNSGNSHKSEKQVKRERTPQVRKIQAKRSEVIREHEMEDKKMLESINRTEYPKIHKLQINIDKALFVLEIMKEKSYDGLNPSQIRAILSEVFRIKANLAAISMALINDKHYTEKEAVSYKGTQANKYRIMKSGEDYIKKKIAELDNHSGPKAGASNANLSSSNPRDKKSGDSKPI